MTPQTHADNSKGDTEELPVFNLDDILKDTEQPVAPEIVELFETLGEQYPEVLPTPRIVTSTTPLNAHIAMALVHIEEKLDTLLAALEQPVPQVSDSTTLDLIDVQRLGDLCRKHLDMSLMATLDHLGLGCQADFADAHDFTLACKSITYQIIKSEQPVRIYRASTLRARNNSLYLSLDFGFGTVAFFSTAELDDALHATAHLLAPWRELGFIYDFNPYISVKLAYDARSFPRIIDVTEPTAEPETL